MATNKKAAGEGSLRKKTVMSHDKPYTYWEGRLTVGRDPGTGKQIQRTFYGKTQKEVREKMQEAAVALTTGDYLTPTKITLGDWLTLWMEDYCGDKKYLTNKTYRAQVENHIRPALGAVKLSQLTAPQIQHFYNTLLKEGRVVTHKDRKSGKTVTEKKPLSEKAVRNIHGVLTKALSVAVQLDYIRVNPCDKVTLPRVEKKEIVPLTDAQVAALLKASDGDAVCGDMLKVIVFSGLRLSEATGLTWDDIDFEKQQITVRKQLQKRPNADGGFVFASLKNDRIRVITVAPYVIDVLRSHKTRQERDKLAAGDDWQGWKTRSEMATALVFTNALGEHLHPQTVYSHLKKLAVEIGAPDACVHDLRHTFAVLSLENGDDIKTVQSNLGHATASFTLDTYAHVSERMRNDSANRMQRFIEEIKTS